MKKKILTVVLGVMLTMLAVTGCGQNRDVKSADENPTANTATGEGAENEEAEEAETEAESGSDSDDIKEENAETDAQESEIDTPDTNENDEKNEPKLVFDTTDIDGKAVSFADYSDAKLIMINFWEPWCGPCVGEMPELEKLYEEYKSEGFVILGVFSTEGVDDDVREVLESCDTTYPVLRYTDELESFVTDYVPTTVFLDKDGNLLTDEPIVGAHSYDDWKQIIEEYMNR